MPFYLTEKDVLSEVDDAKSVLIVPCRFCPAASMAVTSSEPYLEFPRRLLKTASYERFVKRLKSIFEDRGVKTDVFRSRLLHQFVLCMWTSKRRKDLAERAKQYEVLVVIGCDAAAQTVRESVKSTECRVIAGMKSEGIMNVKPKFDWPCSVALELEGVTPYEVSAKGGQEQN